MEAICPLKVIDDSDLVSVELFPHEKNKNT